MRPYAVTAVFDALFVPLYYPVITGAVIPSVQGAVAEQTVHILITLMTGVVFTILVGKKRGRIPVFHCYSPSKNRLIPSFAEG